MKKIYSTLELLGWTAGVILNLSNAISEALPDECEKLDNLYDNITGLITEIDRAEKIGVYQDLIEEMTECSADLKQKLAELRGDAA